MAKSKAKEIELRPYTAKNGDEHRASIKSETHRIFDTKGREEAIAFAVDQGLQKTTGYVWTSSWAPRSKRSAPAAKAATRKAAVKGKTSAKKPARKAKAKARAKPAATAAE